MALFSGDSIFIPGNMQVYEDAFTAAGSIKRLKSITGLKFLLSSWDETRRESEIYNVMDAGLEYLQKIHDIVTETVNKTDKDPMELCKGVVSALGLPQAAVNPLVAKSFQSNLKILRK